MLEYSQFFSHTLSRTLFPFLTLILFFCCCLTSHKKSEKKVNWNGPLLAFVCSFISLLLLVFAVFSTIYFWSQHLLQAFKTKKTNRKTKILLWKMGKTKCNLYHRDYCLDKYDKNVKLFVFSSHELVCVCACACDVRVCALWMYYTWFVCVAANNKTSHNSIDGDFDTSWVERTHRKHSVPSKC